MPLFERMKTTVQHMGTGVCQARSRHLERHRPSGFRFAKPGAKPQPMFCLLRHRIQAMNLVVGSLLHTLPEPEDAPERNPFK